MFLDSFIWNYCWDFSLLNIFLFSVGVRVLPGDDVVSQQWGQEVDLEEVFVQILPVRPGGDLVHGSLGTGWLSEQVLLCY